MPAGRVEFLTVLVDFSMMLRAFKVEALATSGLSKHDVDVMRRALLSMVRTVPSLGHRLRPPRWCVVCFLAAWPWLLVRLWWLVPSSKSFSNGCVADRCDRTRCSRLRRPAERSLTCFVMLVSPARRASPQAPRVPHWPNTPGDIGSTAENIPQRAVFFLPRHVDNSDAPTAKSGVNAYRAHHHAKHATCRGEQQKAGKNAAPTLSMQSLSLDLLIVAPLPWKRCQIAPRPRSLMSSSPDTLR
jgi:hypothetical protein